MAARDARDRERVRERVSVCERAYADGEQDQLLHKQRMNRAHSCSLSSKGKSFVSVSVTSFSPSVLLQLPIENATSHFYHCC
jgi:hypothetical protein